MDLRFVPLNAEHSCMILDRCFDDVQSFYSLRNWPEEGWGLSDPQFWGDSYAILDGDELVGEFSHMPMEKGLGIGLTMRPDLTGKGNGPAFLNAVLGWAKERYDQDLFFVSAWELNERALRTYRKACFEIIGREKLSLNGFPFSFLTLTFRR